MEERVWSLESVAKQAEKAGLCATVRDNTSIRIWHKPSENWWTFYSVEAAIAFVRGWKAASDWRLIKPVNG